MTADWKPGDKALCVASFVARATVSHVKARGHNMPDGLPVKGTIYLVERVRSNGGLIICGVRALACDGSVIGWVPWRFRKVVALGDRVACEESVGV